MGESSWIFHHPSFSLSGTESLSSGLSVALFITTQGQRILLKSCTNTVLCPWLPGKSRIWTELFLLPPCACALGTKLRAGAGTSGQGVPGRDAGSVSLSCLRASALCRRHCLAVEYFAQHLTGFRSTTKSAGCCCSANELTVTTEEIWGFAVGWGRKEWDTSALRLLLVIIWVATLPADCLQGQGLRCARHIHAAKAELFPTPKKGVFQLSWAAWALGEQGYWDDTGPEGKTRIVVATHCHAEAV